MEHKAEGTCVFVIVQDYGHFAYTTHLAMALHNAGHSIEYWSHTSAEEQCPKFASFHSLTSVQEFTNFYCVQSSYGDDDLENIIRMSSGINELIESSFPHTNPLEGISGEPERVAALKSRLLQPDVVLCVNDKCHLFSWAGEHCEKYGVATLNLCPSQHEIQRQHAGVLGAWRQIFARITTWPPPPPQEKYSPVRDPAIPAPLVPGLYITYDSLIPDEKLLPAGREVAGPVYMGAEEAQEQTEQLRACGLQQWLDSDPRPVVYVSLGSMIRNFSALKGDGDAAAIGDRGIRALFRALLRPARAATCRVLTTIPSEVYQDLEEGQEVRCCSWVPQFAVLAHPRVVAFVSHCGANSVHEAIFHAVPIIAVPFFDDQRYNAPRLVELGLAAASLSKEHMTEQQVEAALEMVLCKQKQHSGIHHNMRQASERARSADGLGRLVAESKRLIKHSVSTPHMRSARK